MLFMSIALYIIKPWFELIIDTDSIKGSVQTQYYGFDF